jgi:uncharacterized protein YPO0396
MSKPPVIRDLEQLIEAFSADDENHNENWVRNPLRRAIKLIEIQRAELLQVKSLLNRIHKATAQFYTKEKEGHRNKVDNCPYEQIRDLYKRIMFNFPEVRKLTNKRKTAMRKRWCEDLTSLEDWEAYFKDAAKKRFLMGQNERGWKADFDFFLREDVITKMQEGVYDAR